MNRLTFITVAVLLLFPGCSDSRTGGGENQVWKSQHFAVSARIADGWRQTGIRENGDTFDRPDAVLMAFVNDIGPYGYILRLELDGTFDQLSNADYFDAVQSQFSSHPAYTFDTARDADFHNMKARLLCFDVNGAKGDARMHVYLHRNASHLLTVQMSFPSQADNLVLPPELQELDSGVNVSLKLPEGG